MDPALCRLGQSKKTVMLQRHETYFTWLAGQKRT
jgi:hypothetical protein